MWGTDLVLKDNHYLGPIKDWESALYQFDIESGTGDFIYNQCRKTIETGDDSQAAVDRLWDCVLLLNDGIRWPEYQQNKIPEDLQCKTRLCDIYQSLRFKLAKWAIDPEDQDWDKFHRKFRSWHGLTRDPFILAFCLAIELGYDYFVHGMSIPWDLYDRTTWAWHKFLKKPTQRNFDRYDRREFMSTKTNEPEYQQVLKYYRKKYARQIAKEHNLETYV